MRTVTVEHNLENTAFLLWLFVDGNMVYSTAIFYDEDDELGLVKRISKFLKNGEAKA